MSRAKPTLGYPSRTAAILALRAKGFTNQEIAEQIGIQPCTVGALLTSYRHTAAARQGRRTVQVGADLYGELRLQAARRGIAADELIQRIIDAVLAAKLVDAVLDDGLPS